MSEPIQKYDVLDSNIVESLILRGDISGLSQKQRSEYYRAFCKRLGLDASAQPFQILKLQGKETLYLTRAGAQQLNQLHNVSHQITSRERVDDVGVYQVTARASLPDGRFTESIGAVSIAGLKNDAYANAIMKAETKAKRRSTLDLLGLGILDETEVETIPKAQLVSIDGDNITVAGQLEMPQVNELNKKIMDCENINQVKKLWSSLSEDEKAVVKPFKELKEKQLVREKIEYYINKLDKTNFDKMQYFIEDVITTESGERRRELTDLYNNKLIDLKISHQLDQDLPFGEVV